MKTLLIFLLCLFSVCVFSQTNSTNVMPILNGKLQSGLNANGQTISNASSITTTNLTVNGVSITGNGSTNSITNNQTNVTLSGTFSGTHNGNGAGLTNLSTNGLPSDVMLTDGANQTVTQQPTFQSGINELGDWYRMPNVGGISSVNQPLWIFGGNSNLATNLMGDWGPQVASPGPRVNISFVFITTNFSAGSTPILTNGSTIFYLPTGGYNSGSIGMEMGNGAPLNGIGVFQLVNNGGGPIAIAQSMNVGGVNGNYEYIAVSNGITHFAKFTAGSIGIGGPSNTVDALVVTNSNGEVGILDALWIGTNLYVAGRQWSSSGGINGAAVDPSTTISALNFISAPSYGGGNQTVAEFANFAWVMTNYSITLAAANGGIVHVFDDNKINIPNVPSEQINCPLVVGGINGGNALSNEFQVEYPAGTILFGVRTNGSGITIGASTNTPSFTIVRTNWVSGQLYTNNTGRNIEGHFPAQITMTGVAGAANISVVVTGVITNMLAQTTLITSLSTSFTNQVPATIIPNGGVFTVTNLSTGSGDSGGPVAGGYYIVL